jgi:phosphoribosylamine--glycine ligase
MRFLGIGETCDLGSLYLRLAADGHQVRVSVSEPLCHGTLAGMIQRVENWENELSWIREVGADGIILFEGVSDGSGLRQDSLRAQGFNVIGGSAFGDRLENDRAYAQRVLRDLGLPIATMEEFDRPEQSAAYIAAHPGRYVLKFNGGADFGATDNYVGQLADGRDVQAMVEAKFRQTNASHISFVLMEHIAGVEMGVGAYFNGERFLTPACLDWEHKKFFPGDLGELTGEMGTVATYERSSTFFGRTLERMAPLLRKNHYCGYINLNTIVNAEGIWPLEFTCRFGYPGFAVLEPLQITPWHALFKEMTRRSRSQFAVWPGFSVGVVLTTRPFPYVRTHVPEPVGLPIMFNGALSEADNSNLHFGEVGLDGGQLVTAGYHGWTMVTTGTGATIEAAKSEAYSLASRVVVPNLRYRNDIGAKLIAGDYAAVEALNLLDPVSPGLV